VRGAVATQAGEEAVELEVAGRHAYDGAPLAIMPPSMTNSEPVT
jgi:hypothetical protein